MPGETTPKIARWEGTQTYKKPGTVGKKARTVAQLREEAAAKSKASREAAISARRGSIGGSTRDLPAHAVPDTPTTANLRRRGSTGGIPPPDAEEEPDMPGSGKKKRNGSGGKSDEAEGDGVDPALKRFLMSMKADLIDSTKEVVGKLETRLERNEASIAALEERVERGEKAIQEKITSEITRICKTTTTATKPATPDKRDAAYRFCRRSLKLWPVEGDGEGLEDAVRHFLKNKLGMTDGRIRALGSIEASVLPGRMARERKEVLATFETREDRDGVKGNGINLAGKHDVGMLLHVLGYLMDNLVALNGLGYAIKQKHQGVKRSVKFDDIRRNLYLDICIAGQWRRVTPEEAKQALKEVPAASSASSASISVSDLTELMQGGQAEGLGAVVVPQDDMEA